MMKASETQLLLLLNGMQHYRIPLFQRPYTWNEKNWRALWNDLIETYEMGAESRHFLGSLVTKSLPATPEGVSPFLVIDGQQRLTTLTILLAVIRDVARDSRPRLSELVNEVYLTNRYSAGDTHYKVLPTQTDRPGYFTLINGSGGDDPSLMAQAYRYFRKQILESDPDEGEIAVEGVDIERLLQIVTHGVEMVSITLGDSDNEYRIFESLNGKGTPLSQADLLRNYIFMRIPLDRHDHAYHILWLPMQRKLHHHLEDFFRYRLMSQGMFVRQGDVYQEWKRQLERRAPDELIGELDQFAVDAEYYHRLVSPRGEPNPAIAERLAWLNRWGGQTMYPFLLNVYRQYGCGALEAAAFAEILVLIESFLVRRLFASVPTNALNRLFLRLYSQLPDGADLVQGTRMALSDPGRRWPRDADFIRGLLGYPLYTNSRPDQRRLILERFEESYEHKERPELNSLTIEHIMPQTLTEDWEAELGDDAREVHARFVHVLGNLTLTGYNPELSNRPFSKKRDLLAASSLRMNQRIAQEPEWTARQIEQRARELAERALRIWPGPIAD